MKLSNSIALSSEPAVIATGVSPNSKLTHPRGGLKIGALGGLRSTSTCAAPTPTSAPSGTRRASWASRTSPTRDAANVDLPYAQPFSLYIDHFIATAHVLEGKLKGRLKGISPMEVKEKLDRGEKPLLLDVRGTDELEAMRLGMGETLVPLSAPQGTAT